MIDLQEVNQSHLKMGSDDPLYLATHSAGSLSFTRAIGSIGVMFTSNVVESVNDHQLDDSAQGEMVEVGGGFGVKPSHSD